MNTESAAFWTNRFAQASAVLSSQTGGGIVSIGISKVVENRFWVPIEIVTSGKFLKLGKSETVSYVVPLAEMTKSDLEK